jgi:hypothetical protein
MSWHFAFATNTRAEAHEKIVEAVAKNASHCPPTIVDAVSTLIDLMAAESPKPIVVLSYGHIQDGIGTALIEVKIAP